MLFGLLICSTMEVAGVTWSFDLQITHGSASLHVTSFNLQYHEGEAQIQVLGSCWMAAIHEGEESRATTFFFRKYRKSFAASFIRW